MTVFLFLRGSYGLLIQVTKQLFVNDIQMEVSREIMDQNARIPVAATLRHFFTKKSSRPKVRISRPFSWVQGQEK